MNRNFRQDDRIGRRNRIFRPFSLSSFARLRRDTSTFHFPLFKKSASPGPFKIQHSKFKTKKASSLITSLLVLVVLSTIVVAFMQSMSIERSVARSLKNTYVAEIAANAGLEELVRTLGAATNFHYAVGTELISGTNGGAVMMIKQQGSTNVVSTNKLYSTDAGGQDARIRLGPNTILEAKFVNLTNSKGEIVSRYAFWAEDESAKQNISQYQGLARTNSAMTNISQLPLVEPNLTNWPAIAYTTNYANLRASGFTLPSANQLPEAANLESPISEFYYTIESPSGLLTPEGFPRLELQKLKDYVDGFASGSPLPYTQGPASPRVQLVRQLLNETGTNSADQMNPWGRGSMSFLTNAYSMTEARQIVANILDYIDEDLIPTTDGTAGIQPTSLDLVSSSKTSNNPNSIFSMTTPPTFLGQEARAESNGFSIRVKGHPFITYVGSGFIINSGSSPINSTRILGWLQVVNPYENSLTWKIGSSDGYFMDLQIGLAGSVTGGSRGASPQSTGAMGYFLTHGLAQYSGYSGAPGESHIGRSLSSKSKIMFPREWSGGLDLANGFYSIFSPAIDIQNFTQTIQVCRLVYRLNGQRYIVQDLGALQDVPRTYTPSTTSFGSPAIIKHPYSQDDWHLIGDPRINYQTNDWRLQTSTGAPNGPISASGGLAVYSSPTNVTKDDRQNLPDANNWYANSFVTNHFATFEQGYRPSLPAGQKAMIGYNEFGFISAGRPWQTLRLYNSTNSTNSNYADWRIAEYIDIGSLNVDTNSMDTVVSDGQINVNTLKPSSMMSLIGNLPSPTNAAVLADQLISGRTNVLLRPTDIFEIESGAGAFVLTNSSTTDFGKETLYAQIAPALTSHGGRFTVYSLGQAMQFGQPKSTYLLQALVELQPVLVNGTYLLRPVILSTRKIN